MSLRTWWSRAARPAAHASRPPQTAGRLLVLEEGQTPSGDYLLRPWLRQWALPVHTLAGDGPPPVGWCRPNDFVVVLRYLSADWRRAIEARRADLAGLAWFLDDDLLDPQALQELPPDYARKLRDRGLGQVPWFEAMGAQWWFATEALALKYPDRAGQVLPLDPLPELRPRGAEPPGEPPVHGVRLAYHGSASHTREWAWLAEWLPALQQQCPHTHVELIGDLAVNRRFRDLPRVTVLHPMRWPNYLAHTHSRRIDIGLAPLLPGRFNAGRGAVKFYDYARMGAFGLYSAVPPYDGFIRPDQDGLLLPNDPEAWLRGIVALAADPETRLRLARSAWVRAQGDGSTRRY